jgi:hypothetical protein
MEHEFNVEYLSAEYKKPGPLPYKVDLYICDEELPPPYDNNPGEAHERLRLTLAINHLTKLTVDLRKLPKDAFKEFRSRHSGKYYKVTYTMGLTFGGGGLEFKFLYGGQVMGAVAADYS